MAGLPGAVRLIAGTDTDVVRTAAIVGKPHTGFHASHRALWELAASDEERPAQ